jgi:hypothetical protein
VLGFYSFPTPYKKKFPSAASDQVLLRLDSQLCPSSYQQ